MALIASEWKRYPPMRAGTQQPFDEMQFRALEIFLYLLMIQLAVPRKPPGSETQAPRNRSSGKNSADMIGDRDVFFSAGRR
jgi:hypothetical protein